MSTSCDLWIEKTFGTGPAGSRNSTVTVATGSQIVRVSGLYALQVEALVSLFRACHGDPSDRRFDSWKQEEHLVFEVVPFSKVSMAEYLPSNGTIRIRYETPAGPKRAVYANNERLWDHLRAHLQLKESEGEVNLVDALVGSTPIRALAILAVFFAVVVRHPAIYWIAGGMIVLFLANVCWRVAYRPVRRILRADDDSKSTPGQTVRVTTQID